MENMGLYLLALIIPLIAQIYVSSRYKKYSSLDNDKGLSGFEVARKILDKNGLNDLHIVETSGTMTDHYDPRRKVVRLSKDVFHGTSIASIAIAAHECGHAIQDKEGYSFMKFRSFIFPVVNLGTRFAYIVLFIGLIANLIDFIWLGIMLVGLGLVFQLVTLPVEFNASNRALKEIELSFKKVDYQGTKDMLNAAAMTYVAGVLSSVLEILRLILIFNDRRD